MSQPLDSAQRATFLALADVLIPTAEGMPSASDAGIGGTLDRILSLRPDLSEAFFRGLRAAAGTPAAAAAEALNGADAEALAVIGLIAAAAYYMSPEVRARIGYPGQEKREFDADATPEYVTNGMLQRVIDRGSIYRPTPA
jgi:hypothetical protein